MAWTKKQVKTILKSTLNRIKADPSYFDLKNEGDSVVINKMAQQGGGSTVDRNKSIYISIDTDTDPRNIYISLGSVSSSYTLSKIPFFDLEIRALRKELIQFVINKGMSNEQIIMELFPETISQSFEQEVLGVKDDK